MKKCCWNEDYILQLMSICDEEIRKDSNSPYNVDRSLLLSLLEDDIECFPLDDDFSLRMMDDATAMLNMSSFYREIYQFSLLDDLITNDPGLYELEVDTSLLTSFTHDFYNGFDKEISSAFNKSFRQRRETLKFSNERSINIYLPNLKKSFIIAGREDMISDFTNIIHEYGHSISDCIYYREGYEDNYPFVELLPMFMEMLATDELEERFCFTDNSINEDTQALRVIDAKTQTKSAVAVRDLVNYMTKCDCDKTKDDAVKKIADMFEISEEQAKSYFNISLRERLSYLIPYMTAIELYYVYKLDPNRAITILKNIVKAKPMDDYHFLLLSNGIILNQHSEEYVKSLIKKTGF